MLKLSQDFKEQGKQLFKENPKQYDKLRGYGIVIEDHILWQERDQIVLFLKIFFELQI